MAPIQRKWTIGRNTFHFEAPDVLWARFQGGCCLDEAILLVKLYRELGSVHPFYLLSDMEAAGGIDAEARRYINEHVRQEWLLGVIYFRTRLLHRAIAKGLLLAAEMTRSEDDPPSTKIYFVSTRERAREFLVQLRARQDEHRV
ncbi:hypothetical protein [Cystobacter ferrugineus]|uniref:Uncharacterized protein n=1 Tax=Cystobacter ferrugineus TaxID=83449 RepID=A0A1L9BJQ0_9BACT|nr:hypothetical protein [Cystobacter ferrugineus]OJH42500.1 hypothetical protein BON30_04715 [Cystobacter ferrugineus]